jgi:hypothetical protein
MPLSRKTQQDVINGRLSKHFDMYTFLWKNNGYRLRHIHLGAFSRFSLFHWNIHSLRCWFGNGKHFVDFCFDPFYVKRSERNRMALTILAINQSLTTGLYRTAIYFSQEYMPYKATDAVGAVLTGQEWQRPDAETLRYCDIGELVTDTRVDGLLSTLLSLGAAEMGGHIRILFMDECPWLNGHLETWADRWARSQRELEERERQHVAELAAMEAMRAPILGYCPRCFRQTEQCKGDRHRGENRCMKCNGDLGDPNRRWCANCIDLPYREKREAALGHAIVYAGEELPEGGWNEMAARVEKPFARGSVCKPCWELNYCPYWDLVEYFPFAGEDIDMEDIRQGYQDALIQLKSGKLSTEEDVWEAVQQLTATAANEELGDREGSKPAFF